MTTTRRIRRAIIKIYIGSLVVTGIVTLFFILLNPAEWRFGLLCGLGFCILEIAVVPLLWLRFTYVPGALESVEGKSTSPETLPVEHRP